MTAGDTGQMHLPPLSRLWNYCLHVHPLCGVYGELSPGCGVRWQTVSTLEADTHTPDAHKHTHTRPAPDRAALRAA